MTLETLPFPLWEGVIRLTLAAFLGALIGFERERRRQPAGFRTHAVLALGSSLMSLLSVYVSYRYGNHADPGRVISQVLAGIGFLGAGAILRMGTSVKGLTTAASLWTTAGIGLAVGAGMYMLSVVSVFLLLGILAPMSRIERELLGKSTALLTLMLEEVQDPVEYLRSIGDVRIVMLEKREAGYYIKLEIPLYGKTQQDLIQELLDRKEVKAVELLSAPPSL
ncbi:MgtC/SapB transporter [Thermocrinis albus DSM 14484]|uniref:MgtC/SapB transporter n=1 Tax=Thermocrinis albus (strain DSM 14484 / JCM 11386 / HI 11/12) TaxID=638303 RepID=D3SMD1_THEAH|nr:MgtC/SapB family protein [Thermocrinis albus]ADC89911.1 MgtC/SapB transporter [Thermocrinis albus DSM 14484]